MRPMPTERDLLRWEDDGGAAHTTPSFEMMLGANAMVDQALAKCAALGIPGDDFLAALMEEIRLEKKVKPSELFRRSFERMAHRRSTTPAPPE